MALSTLCRLSLRSGALRQAIRPACLLGRETVTIGGIAPMASSAKDSMREFWKKNQSLNRPVSPWIIYRWEFPMLTSLTHRVTGILMGGSLYCISIMYLGTGGDWQMIINFLADLNLGPMIWAPFKALMAFPLTYHCMNGVRHMWFDFKGGYEITQQYKSGYLTYGCAIFTSLFVTALCYM